MSETHVKGRVLYRPGIWGAARPAPGVKVEVLDQDVGNPDDVLWTGTTGGPPGAGAWCTVLLTGSVTAPWEPHRSTSGAARSPPGVSASGAKVC